MSRPVPEFRRTPRPRGNAGVGGSLGRWRTCLVALALPLWIGVFTACHTWRPAPLDLSRPEWQVRQGQAVWHPPGGELEIVGELVLAKSKTSGYLEFSKPPLRLAETRIEEDRWLASFPMEHKTFSGRGDPPARIAWSQVLKVALGKAPSKGWELSGSISNRWRLENRSSGEWIEATLLR